MENKTTTELLDLVHKLSESGESGTIGDGYEKALEELQNREPFFTILSEDLDDSLPLLAERIKDLQEEIKKLKRHKHEEKTGDVLIRI